MAVISEIELIERLSKSKRVLLLEPPYVRRYLPLGLAKISTLVKSFGGEVVYSRRTVPDKFDLICVATCFTSDSKIVMKEISECKRSLFLRNTPIIVGGIFASLMPELFKGVDVFTGCSKELDGLVPDYDSFDINPPFDKTGLLFTTRGCANRCPYCMVYQLEPESEIITGWGNQITGTERKDLIISDNSLLSFPLEHLEKLTFLLNKYGKRAMFNNGLDCRSITDTNAKLIASIKYFRNDFRTAFDRMSDDGHYQIAMEKVAKAGLKIKGNSYTYVLYNFDDTPQEAYYRAKECWKHGSNPYLMRFRPLDCLEKGKIVGKYWTENLVRAFSNWGQNYGYNRGDGTFESWVRSGKSRLTEEDWEKWNYKR